MQSKINSLPACSLRWSILTRFTEYVTGMPDGDIALSDGATRESHATFAFPFQGDGGRPGVAVFRFHGAVRFTGHHGMLDVMIAQPIVEIADDTLSLLISDGEGGSLTFAQGNAAHIVNGNAIELRLTVEGSDLFFGRYPAGYPLDPLPHGMPFANLP